MLACRIADRHKQKIRHQYSGGGAIIRKPRAQCAFAKKGWTPLSQRNSKKL